MINCRFEAWTYLRTLINRVRRLNSALLQNVPGTCPIPLPVPWWMLLLPRFTCFFYWPYAYVDASTVC